VTKGKKKATQKPRKGGQKKSTAKPSKVQARPKKKPNAVSQIEIYKRCECVEEAISEGCYSTREVIEYLEEHGFPRLGRWSVERYIKMVKAKWEEERETDRQALRDVAIRRTRRILNKTLKNLAGADPNYSDAINLLRELHKIEGVYAPEQHEIKAVREFSEWTDDELDHYANTGEEPQRLAAKNVIDVDPDEDRTVH
jgi:hypothetical protein